MAAEGAAVAELARPKVNLWLHVAGRRPDGYHTLDSLAVFLETGDRIEAEAAPMLSMSLGGPFGVELAADAGNLALRAALALQEAAPSATGAALHLDKRLPIASGLGGGSADAAATLRALNRLWGAGLDAPALERIALSLGADVPVCIESRARRMSGIGEILGEAPALPRCWLVLLNPLRATPTPAVFSALQTRSGPAPEPPAEGWPDARALAAWLNAHTVNDLTAPAKTLTPDIDVLLGALEGAGALLSRMSGSGATCFGIFETREAALAAERALRSALPSCWIDAAPLSAPA